MFDGVDVDDFLSRVNEVGDLVTKLKTAQSAEEVENATSVADAYLKKRDRERTKINNLKPLEEEELDNRREGRLDQMSADEFMQTVSEDAKRRSEEKKNRKSRSDLYKKEANIAFRSGDYAKAMDLYNKAIEEVCDSCVLYTNRALTRLHLQQHTDVLEDCKAALRINPGSLKALVYKARAHRALGQGELAEQSTQEAVNLHPHHKAFIRHSVLRDNISPDRSQKDAKKSAEPLDN